MHIDIASVGATAVLTAHMRARESARPDRLFDDPAASQLVEASGLSYAVEVTLPAVISGRIYESVVARTHYLDGRLSNLTFAQVVILGAGLDTRAARLGWNAGGVSTWEVDKADVLGAKSEVLGAKRHRCWRSIEADLSRPGWYDQLVADGFDVSASTVWICEGLFMYLRDDEAKAIVATVAERAKGPTTLLAVHFGEGAYIEAHTKHMAAQAEAGGFGFKSVLAPSAEDWLGRRWEVRDARSIAQYAATLGRTVPYDEKSIGKPVTWLLEASLRGIESR